MTYKVRPFEKMIYRADFPMLPASGRIEESTFVFAVAGQEYRIPTVEAGTDKWGAFVSIEEGTTKLADDWRLVIEMEPDEGGPTGVNIILRKIDPGMVETLRQRGVDPDNPNVILPVDASLRVSFNSRGTCDGSGWVGPARQGVGDPLARRAKA